MGSSSLRVGPRSTLSALPICAPALDDPNAKRWSLVRISEIARVCCVLVLLLYGLGYLSPLWAWAFCAVSWIVLSDLTVRPLRFTPLDYAVIGLLLFELISIPASSYPSNGWVYAEQLTIAACLYFSISRLRSQTSLGFVVVVAGSIAVTFVARDLGHFTNRYSEWRQLRFGSLADVKRSLTVADLTPAGVHYTIYLCFLTWAVTAFSIKGRRSQLMRWVGWATVAASLTGLVLSLSRGLYLGALAGAFCLSGFLWKRPRRTRPNGRLTAFAAIAVFLAATGFSLTGGVARDVLALLGNGNTSTQRSVQGRVSIWERTFQLAESRPWLGFGARTFSLYGAHAMTRDEGEPIDRAFSLPVQVAFERGAIGFIIYTAFFVVVFHTAWAKMRTPAIRHNMAFSLSCAAAAGLAALLVRELTFTTLFDDMGVTVWAFSLIGLIRLDSSNSPASECAHSAAVSRQDLIAFALVLILGVVVGGQRIRRAMSDFYSAQAIAAESVYDHKSATDLGLRAVALLPTPYSRAQLGLFFARGADIRLGAQGFPMLADAGLDRTSLLTKAQSAYEQSLKAFPNDPAWLLNLAFLHWVEGNHDAALQMANRAVDLEPNTALYRQSLISILLAESSLGSAAHDHLVRLLVSAPEVVDSRWWRLISEQHADLSRSALQDAIAALNSSAEKGPIRTARAARLYLEAGKFSAAEDLLHSALVSLPGLAGAWRNYGLILARRGQWDRATEALERAIFLDPWDFAAYYALSRVVLQLDAGSSQEHAENIRLSSMFYAKAFRIQNALRRTPASLRAFREFRVEATVPDDLVVDGLLRFCAPDMTSEYDKVVQ